MNQSAEYLTLTDRPWSYSFRFVLQNRFQRSATARFHIPNHARLKLQFLYAGIPRRYKDYFTRHGFKAPSLKSTFIDLSPERGGRSSRRKSISRDVYENEFFRLVKLLEIKLEAIERMTVLAAQVNVTMAEEKDLETQRQRRLRCADAAFKPRLTCMERDESTVGASS